MQKAGTYELVDSGNGRKLERFGPFLLSRPCSQAVWKSSLGNDVWQNADAIFTRDEENRWLKKKGLPDTWSIDVDGLLLQITPTDFGHLGIFPEQRPYWEWMRNTVKSAVTVKAQRPKVLNLFAYSGGATLACAQGGAEVCHLDASKGMVAWARENARLNALESAPVRWIIDDVMKFLKREIKRESRYDAIILDPPTFGRGAQKELFKIEEQIIPLLEMCASLLVKEPLFVLFSCHTPGFTPIALQNLLSQTLKVSPSTIESGEMMLNASEKSATERSKCLPIPSGSFARWQHG